MKHFLKSRVAVLASTLALAVLLIASTPRKARATNDNAAGVLSAVWWIWFYSIPVVDNPAFDATGANAFSNQPFNDLMFLAGTASSFVVNDNVFGTAERTINVSRGTAFFFPLITSEWDNVVFDAGGPGIAKVVKGKNALTVPQLRANAAAQMDAAIGLFCTLTPKGKKAQNVPFDRLQSPVFPYYLPPGNTYSAYGQQITGIVTPAVSDGYWSFVPPLDKGTYTLRFGGSIPIDDKGHTFSLDITYHIKVK